ECNYAPFNWTQVADSDTAVAISGGGGYCDGYDIAIAQLIAESMDKELVVKKIAWEGLVLAVQAGDIDMIVAGMTDTEERRASIDFSDYYYASNMVMIVKSDSNYVDAQSLEDFAGAAVVGQKETFHDSIVDQIPSVNHLVPLKSFPEMTVAVNSGAADAMVSELPVAQAIVATNPNLRIVEFAEGSGFVTDAEDVTVSVGLKKGNTELQTAINAALANISEAQRTELMNAAISRQPE
ncbi:MAG: transporter substrate-binding domain-containing protein, partial [Erysipelotrichaceae bacterium]